MFLIEFLSERKKKIGSPQASMETAMLLDSFRTLGTQEFLFLDPVYSRFVDSRSYFDRLATF